jgi:hypothetical protein
MNPTNVTEIVGPFKATGSATEALTAVGDASLGGANANGTPETVFLCFRTELSGPWQLFPAAVQDITWVQTNVSVAQARTGFLTSTTFPTLVPGTTYYVALCGGTQITLATTNSWVTNAKVIVTHLP